MKQPCTGIYCKCDDCKDAVSYTMVIPRVKDSMKFFNELTFLHKMRDKRLYKLIRKT